MKQEMEDPAEMRETEFRAPGRPVEAASWPRTADTGFHPGELPRRAPQEGILFNTHRQQTTSFSMAGNR